MAQTREGRRDMAVKLTPILLFVIRLDRCCTVYRRVFTRWRGLYKRKGNYPFGAGTWYHRLEAIY
jgi:hypothetical protein